MGHGQKSDEIERVVSFVDLDGFMIRLATSGTGPPLLFLNGSGPGATIEAVKSVLDRFSRTFSVACHDQRGLGQSGSPPGTWTMADYATDAFRVADHLGWSTFDVVGVSFGGMVALEMAASNPERLRHLVVWGATPGGTVPSYPLHELAALSAGEREAVLRSLLDTRTITPAPPTGLSTRLVEGQANQVRREPTWQVPGPVDPDADRERHRGLASQIEARRHHDVQGRLTQVRCPTFAGAGSFDELAPPAHVRAIVTEIPHTHYQEYPHGHFFFLHEEALADAVSFLTDGGGHGVVRSGESGVSVASASMGPPALPPSALDRALCCVAEALGFTGVRIDSVGEPTRMLDAVEVGLKRGDTGIELGELRVVVVSSSSVAVALDECDLVVGVDLSTASPEMAIEGNEPSSTRLGPVLIPPGSRIPESTISSLSEVLSVLVEQIDNHPDLLDGALDLTANHTTVLHGLGGVSAEPMARIDQRVSAACHRHPERVAIVGPRDDVLTFGELLEAATSVAEFLRARGVARGHVVGIAADRSMSTVVLSLGVLLAGAAYLPLGGEVPAARRSQLFTLAGASFALEAGDHLGAVEIERISHAEAHLDGDVAVIMCTSGSTGVPKAVAVTHRGINRLIDHTGPGAIQPDDVVGMIANASFDAALWELWPALAQGGRVVIFADDHVQRPSLFRSRLERSQVSAMFVTSGLFNSLVRWDSTMFAGLRMVGVGGEALDPPSIRKVLTSGGVPDEIFNGYGPTEATTFTTTFAIAAVEEDALRIPIGSPIADTSVAVVDRRGRLLPPGWPGELFIGGPGLAAGYCDGGLLSQERFVVNDEGPLVGRWYATGDLCVIRDGHVEYLGRLDRQIKVRGFRVDPAEIEVAAESTGLVAAAVVEPVVASSSVSLALVVEPVLPEMTAREILDGLRTRLAPHLIPSRCILVDHLPLTDNGKVDRTALAELIAGREDVPEALDDASATRAGRAHVSSSLEVLDMLTSAWADILGHRDFNLSSRFDEVGGDSLSLIELSVTVAEVTGLAPEAAEAALVRGGVLTLEEMVAELTAVVQPSGLARQGHFMELGAGPSPTIWILTLETVQGPLSFLPFAQAMAGSNRIKASHGLSRDERRIYRSIRGASKGWAERLIAAGFETGDILMGGSGGCVYAFDVSRRLERQGKPPSRMLLIEPSSIDAEPLLRVWGSLLGGRDLMTLRQRWNWLWRWCRGLDGDPSDGSWMWTLRLRFAYYRLTRRRLDIPAVIVIGRESPLFADVEERWSPWCAEVAFVRVSGTHGGQDAVLGRRRVSATIAALRPYLSQHAPSN